jgi:hypothetical protein
MAAVARVTRSESDRLVKFATAFIGAAFLLDFVAGVVDVGVEVVGVDGEDGAGELIEKNLLSLMG